MKVEFSAMRSLGWELHLVILLGVLVMVDIMIAMEVEVYHRES